MPQLTMCLPLEYQQYNAKIILIMLTFCLGYNAILATPLTSKKPACMILCKPALLIVIIRYYMHIESAVFDDVFPCMETNTVTAAYI